MRPPGEFGYVLSKDGMSLLTHGRAAPALLPKADTVVGVVPAVDLAWHRLTLPKAPAAKLRAALAGVLEDALLEDPEDTHFALAPGASPGHEAWLAATNRAWLQVQLGALDAAGVVVDRLVPQAEPGARSHGHFEQEDNATGHGLRLVWSRPDGVLVLRPAGGLSHHWLAGTEPADGTSWSAAPAAVAAAEQALGQRVEVLAPPEAALRSARSAWNLRQFEFAARPRGVRALRKIWHELASPAWRPMRVGLVCLLVINLIGLNAWAWLQRNALAERQKAQVALLQSTFPHVRAVLDAPVQMERETEQLRSRAGKPGDTDIESMLQAVASAWPDGRRLEALRFEPGQLTVSVEGWPDTQIDGLRDRLQPAGWQVVRDGDQLAVRRAASATGGRT